MKQIIQGMIPFALVVGFSGCLTLGDANEVHPPTLGRELTDLKMSMERGALNPQEYEHQKAQLMAGNHPRMREPFVPGRAAADTPQNARWAPQQPPRQYAAPQYSAEQAQYEQPQFDPQMQQMQPPQFVPQDQMQPPAMPHQQLQPQQPPVTQLPPEGWH